METTLVLASYLQNLIVTPDVQIGKQFLAVILPNLVFAFVNLTDKTYLEIGSLVLNPNKTNEYQTN